MAIRTALERYEDIDMTWAGSREANLLKVRCSPAPQLPASRPTDSIIHKSIGAALQHRLCTAQDLADACEEGDVEKFSQVLAEYDSMTKLDSWKTSILLKVKKRIPEEDFT